MKDILDITLRLGNVSLVLGVRRDEEATLREAAKQVNHAWDGFAKRFNDKKPPEIMAMVALLFAKGYVTATETNAETAGFLAQFENELDELLLSDSNLIHP
ncbi:MAG: cell division protein ZapA [Paramuribaculum sp.]|nr:cell division protein ZapA [Paramuribaculum sp.]